MAFPSDDTVIEAPLTLAGLVADLHADNRISDADHTRLARMMAGSVHPLIYLAEQKLPDPSRPGQLLDMDQLLSWLAGRTGQAVYEIDPLKINVGAIAEVMSIDPILGQFLTDELNLTLLGHR